MSSDDILYYLKQQNNNLDSLLLDQIEKSRKDAIAEQNEQKANYYWCVRQIYKIQNNYLTAFNELKNKEYESAWNTLDRTDIAISFLEQNGEYFPITDDDYNIKIIKKNIGNLQKLFPYFIFSSREGIIKEEKCSICGQIVKLREKCKHKPGKLYMGEMCTRTITDYQLLSVSLVNDPFDKYTILHVDGKEYNYKMLETLIPYLNSPYDFWDLETLPMIKPEYKNVGRNAPCPCGSGKKYKKCCLGTNKIYGTHYRIVLDIPHKRELGNIKYINTWKE